MPVALASTHEMQCDACSGGVRVRQTAVPPSSLLVFLIFVFFGHSSPGAAEAVVHAQLVSQVVQAIPNPASEELPRLDPRRQGTTHKESDKDGTAGSTQGDKAVRTKAESTDRPNGRQEEPTCTFRGYN